MRGRLAAKEDLVAMRSLRRWAFCFAWCVLLGTTGRAFPESFVTRQFVEKQFEQFDRVYGAEKSKRLATLATHHRAYLARQKAGEPLPCSAALLSETRWILNATSDFSRADRNLWLLELSLKDPNQAFATKQESYDGSWGVCYSEWFKKLDPMITQLNELAETGTPPETRRLAFLRPIGTPKDMVGTLEALRLSDIPATGVNNRDELGAVASVIAELVFKPKLRTYLQANLASKPDMAAFEAAFWDFVDDWQDPETGYWGPWFRSGFRVLKAPDLSFTFHIVSYREGEVRRWDRIIDTTLALETAEYPYGWRQNGRLTNHHAYDVARLFKLGWPRLDEGQRQKVAAAMDRIAQFALDEGVRPDGTVELVDGFSSGVDDEHYFAVSLLTTAGICSAKPPFWTSRSFPQSERLCCGLMDTMSRMSDPSPRLTAAKTRLAASYPRCGTASVSDTGPSPTGAAEPTRVEINATETVAGHKRHPAPMPD
jgi:hypothetical protein